MAAVLGVGGVLVLTGCNVLPGRPDPYRAPATYRPSSAASDLDAMGLGRQLYQRDCAFCHGNRGQGTERGPDVITGTNGPALTDFMLRTGRMPVEGEVEQTKPGERRYTEREIAAIVAYMDGFGAPGPRLPHGDPSKADLAEGQRVYQEHCGACHAATGIGGAMLTSERRRRTGGGTTGIDIPGLGESDAIEIAEATRTGPGTMPVFGPDLIDDHQLDALVRYTVYLHAPEDRGGAGVGHVGPVVEGAIGWVLGLGVLMLFIRWIGTKAGEVE